ncbi:DNA methyltransferase [Clostridium butyricum]|uniref:DNA methyltransferase n=1 Tax=Clostridium butyricum TaxID=1492 RepID=UPI0002CB7E8A|nr:DNA methyltransferase [Clostridium butyricum]EMU53084.1 hypothetical protein CBDKU1_28590 [Clostridium butyricum DKU-01]
MSKKIDEKIIKILQGKVENDSSFWDFKDDYKKEHIHRIINYPATMVPKMQAEVMNIILESAENIKNIFDPFMGSGTILVEGMLRDLDVYGIDINPLAYLITSVKTKPLEIEHLEIKIKQLFIRIDESNLNYEITSFPGIKKWFREYIIDDLSKIKNSIMEEKDLYYRRVFWISFCQIIREACNSQHSTFKLHIKKEESINNFKYDTINEFKKHILYVKDSMKQFEEILGEKLVKKTKVHYRKKVKVINGNSKSIICDNRRFKKNSIDMIFTSPPYGDNHTTVTYGQYSILQLRWIDLKDIDSKIDLTIVDKLSEIDKRSLGGIYYSCKEIDESNILLKSNTLQRIYNKLIEENEISKARKVASFYIDFNDTLVNCFRILKPDKYAVFTIGNRRVNNEIIEFNKIITELSKHSNATLIYDFSRNILKKTIPGKVSRLKNNEPVKSMKEENILIFRKNN